MEERHKKKTIRRYVGAYLYQPSNELYERRQNGHVSDFFYHQHGQRISVPRQTLAGRVLYCPAGKRKTRVHVTTMRNDYAPSNRYGTYIIIAEVFMIRPHGPNCWTGLGAFNDRVLLKQKKKKRKLVIGRSAWENLMVNFARGRDPSKGMCAYRSTSSMANTSFVSVMTHDEQ